MSVFRIVLILDDTVAAQATLLSNIESALNSIAGNANSFGFNNIEVKKLA